MNGMNAQIMIAGVVIIQTKRYFHKNQNIKKFMTVYDSEMLLFTVH